MSCGDSVHDINLLTVVASESYKNFVGGLQADTKAQLYTRPLKATVQYFEGKTIQVGDVPVVIETVQAKAIYKYLVKNDYIDDDDAIAPLYRQDVESNTLAPLPESLAPMADSVQQLIQSVFDKTVLDDMFTDANKTKIEGNPLNDNFYKKEFQDLWKRINHQYAYTVQFDSDELIQKSIAHINEKLFVTTLQYTTSVGAQKKDMDEHDLARGESFRTAKTRTQQLRHAQSSQIKYDLIGKICAGTTLLRRTVVAILQGIDLDKFYLFKNNPEEFISKVIRLINEQKATTLVEHIGYNPTDGAYDSSIFTAAKPSEQVERAFFAKRHIQDYVFTDGIAEKSIERKFAEELDIAEEVCVYAKLPKGFHIPTPVGDYSPDWAIAFNEGCVKHIFFIAETKGTMESLQLRPIEQAKIKCAKKLFNQISTEHVKYHDVDSYQHLLQVIEGL